MENNFNDDHLTKVKMNRFVDINNKMHKVFNANDEGRKLGDFKLHIKIGTKIKDYVPAYLIEWINHYLYNYRDIIELEHYMAYKSDKGGIFEFSYSVDVGLDALGTEKYSDILLNSDLAPFVIGCGFNLISISSEVFIPTEYHNIPLTEEGKTLIFKDCYDNHFMFDILDNLFNFGVEKINTIEEELRVLSFYELEEKIPEKYCGKVEEVLKAFNIKYSLE